MSVIRISHDKDHKYTMLSNEVLKDMNISNSARGLWAYCMSQKDDWTFYVKHLSKVLKDGKTKIYSQLKELIKAGYVVRLQIREKTPSNKMVIKSLDYVFFERKLSDEEKMEYLNELKKTFPYCNFLESENLDSGFVDSDYVDSGFLNSDNLDSENPQLINTNNNKYQCEEISNLHTPPIPLKGEQSANADWDEDFSLPKIENDFSPAVKELTSEIIQVLKQNDPDYRAPKDLKAYKKHVDLLLRDDYTPESILRVLHWAVKDRTTRGDFMGWSAVIYSRNPIEKLRKHFVSLSAASKCQKERKFAPCSKGNIQESDNYKRFVAGSI